MSVAAGSSPRPSRGAHRSDSGSSPRPAPGADHIATGRPPRGGRRSRTGPAAQDDGRALVEVVVLAVLVLIPVLYLLIALFRVQAATFAVSQAARDTGRLLETSTDLDRSLDLAHHAAALSLADHGVPADGLRISFTAAGAECSGPAVTPTLLPGARYTVCVTATISLPGVPHFLTGSDNTTTASYTVHISELKEYGGDR